MSIIALSASARRLTAHISSLYIYSALYNLNLTPSPLFIFGPVCCIGYLTPLLHDNPRRPVSPAPRSLVFLPLICISSPGFPLLSSVSFASYSVSRMDRRTLFIVCPALTQKGEPPILYAPPAPSLILDLPDSWVSLHYCCCSLISWLSVSLVSPSFVAPGRQIG